MTSAGEHEAAKDTRTRVLAQMMGLDSSGQRLWSQEELGAVLRHQMLTPLDVDLGRLDADAAAQMRTLTRPDDPRTPRFADLLFHDRPPLGLLQRTKEFAKSSRSHPDSPLPVEVATVLYFAAIAAAMVRWGRRITRQGDAALRGGFEWGAALSWIDDPLRALFQEGLKALGGPGAGAAGGA